MAVLLEKLPSLLEFKYDPTIKPYVERDKFAPVAPWHIYEAFLNRNYIPSTVLLLAHDVVAHEEDYARVFDDVRWLSTNIIMDNSLVELKKAVDFQMVEEAVKIVRADIAVLPDAMGDGLQTLDLVRESYDSWKFRLAQTNCDVMPLIHGKDLREWFECAEGLKLYETSWVGIPRRAEGIKDPTCGRIYNRSQLVQYAHEWFGYENIHLFGFSDAVWEDLMAARYECVKSIDSAVPLRQPAILSRNAGPRGDWWEKVKFENWMIDSCKQVNDYLTA